MPGGAHEFMKAWEPDEDQIIMDMHAREGPKWKLIVKKLPGRTVSSVRNRWQRIEKGRKLREEGHELKNRCHACGQPKRGHICQAKMSQVQIAADDSRGWPDVKSETKALMPPPTVLGSAHFSGPPSTGVYAPASSSSQALPASLQLPSIGLLPSGGSGSNPGSAPIVRRTRSASKLIPQEDRARASGGLAFGVDVQNANSIEQHGVYGGDHPDLHRSNTSFFKSLASAGVFSPTSRDMFQSWADPRDSASPRPDVPRLDAASVAEDPAAPVSLRHLASMSQSGQNEGVMEPKVTRSLSNYLSSFDQPATSSPMLSQGSQGVAAAPAPPMVGGSSSALPGLSRQKSGGMPSASRENSAMGLLGGQGPDSFMRDLFDVSATLEPPPPEMLPPGMLSKQDSFGGLLDALK